MTTRYEQIQALFDIGCKVPIGTPSPELERGRTLDAQLSRDFTVPIKQWEDGEISACELAMKLYWIANQEAV